MPQVLFDTHAAARKLEKAGHMAQQAEAVVEVVSSATELVAAGSLSFSLAGLAVMVLTDEFLRAIALEHGSLIGLMMTLASSVVLLFLARPSRS